MILGGGALGAILAAHLHRAGEDVAVVAREPRASVLTKDGIRITGLAEFTAKVPVYTDACVANDADLVIVALKTHQSPAVVRELRPKQGAVAFSVQNGVFKNEELSSVFGANKVLGAIALVSGEVMTDGSIRFTNNDPIFLGEPGQESSSRSKQIVATLQKAGIAAEVSKDIRALEWSKFTMFVPLFCGAIITRQETCRFLRNTDSARVIAALSREMAQLATAEGVLLQPGAGLSAAAMAQVDFESAVRIVRDVGAYYEQKAPRHKVSGLQDLERGRQTEVEEIVGFALRRSEEVGLDLPTLRTCYHLCRAIAAPSAQAPGASSLDLSLERHMTLNHASSSLPVSTSSMELLDLYRQMARIRAFEAAAEEASIGGFAVLGQEIDPRAKIRGALHASIGQEAVAAGVCRHLERSDLVTSSHRGHGHTLAKGADMRRMMAELFGRCDGTNRGKGGSMHIADFSVGMLGANGIVGAGLAIACGAAQALKLQGRTGIVACFFGDGAVNRGPFLEALNWACVYQLPVLFVCEDNQWASTTSTGAFTGGPGVAARAAALGVPAESCDGNDVEVVSATSRRLIGEIRAGKGPRLLHALTSRVRGHVSADKQGYRDAADIERANRADPLQRARKSLLQQGTHIRELDRIDSAVLEEVNQAIAFAEASPLPNPLEAYSEVQTLGEGTWH